jgi:hypothetical protein
MDSALKFSTMNSKMAKFNLSAEIREIVKWTTDSTVLHITHDEPILDILSIVANKESVESVGMIAFKLKLVAIWQEHHALRDAVFDSKSACYKWLHFVDYTRHAMKIRILRAEHPDGGGSISAFELHRHFNLLLGCGLIDEAAWLGQRIYDSIKRHMKQPVVWSLREISASEFDRLVEGEEAPNSRVGPRISAYSDSPLCGYVLRMWLILTGRRGPTDRLPEKAPQCGIYDALFSEWDRPEKLSGPIAAACDFHVHRMKQDRRIHHDIPEFEHSPFRQIPFEILAYRNLRRHFGLETPFPAHPLLDSPFVKSLPETIVPSGDPLLSQVLEFSRRILPDL